MGHSVQKVDTHTRTREIREHTHDARHRNTHTTCIYIDSIHRDVAEHLELQLLCEVSKLTCTRAHVHVHVCKLTTHPKRHPGLPDRGPMWMKGWRLSRALARVATCIGAPIATCITPPRAHARSLFMLCLNQRLHGSPADNFVTRGWRKTKPFNSAADRCCCWDEKGGAYLRVCSRSKLAKRRQRLGALPISLHRH